MIFDVVDLFRVIPDTTAAISDDALPEDYVQQIITIFKTTSGPAFNEISDKFHTDLISM